MGPGQLHAVRGEQELLRRGSAVPRRHPHQRRAGRVRPRGGAADQGGGHGHRDRREGRAHAARRVGRHPRCEAKPQLQPPVHEHQAQAAGQRPGAAGDRVRDRPKGDHRRRRVR